MAQMKCAAQMVHAVHVVQLGTVNSISLHVSSVYNIKNPLHPRLSVSSSHFAHLIPRESLVSFRPLH